MKGRNDTVVATLRALLSQLVDYAGLFPPASLPLDEAIRNYLRYLGGPDAWMLGRFVCPAPRLAELAGFAEQFRKSEPAAPFSVLARGGNTTSEFLANFEQDLAAIRTFHEQHEYLDSASQYRHRAVRADVIEVRLPGDVLTAENGTLRKLLDEVVRRWPSTIWFEAGLSTDWRQTLARVIDALKDRGGLKVRCGGRDASAFPSADQLAFAIAACRDAGVPLKFTAGLHHPIRGYDAGVQAFMHGFLNVFVAGVLAHALRLKEDALRTILEDQEAAHFCFTESECCWRDHVATPKQILAARLKLVTSFGSCSFDEPRDDLRALGLL